MTTDNNTKKDKSKIDNTIDMVIFLEERAAEIDNEDDRQTMVDGLQEVCMMLLKIRMDKDLKKAQYRTKYQRLLNQVDVICNALQCPVKIDKSVQVRRLEREMEAIKAESGMTREELEQGYKYFVSPAEAYV